METSDQEDHGEAGIMRIFEMRIYQSEQGVEVIERTDMKTQERFYASLGMLDQPVMLQGGEMTTKSQQIEFKIPVSSVSRAFKERDKWFSKALEQINARKPQIITPPERN